MRKVTQQDNNRPDGLRFHHATGSALGRISGAGWMTHKGMADWRDLGHHAAALITAGTGHYRDETGRNLRIEPGTLIFVFPNLNHYYHPEPGSEWTEFHLIFDGPAVDFWERQGLLDRNSPVITNLLPAETWAKRFEDVLGPSGTLADTPPLLEMSRLQLVLAQLHQNPSKSSEQDEDLIWIKQARSILEMGPNRHSNIDEIASQIGLSPHYFRRKFLRLSGLSPSRYRTIRTIDCACELMQNSALLDKEIAFKLGFCDEFYFSRRFKEVTGKSPSDFRKALPGTTDDRGGQTQDLARPLN